MAKRKKTPQVISALYRKEQTQKMAEGLKALVDEDCLTADQFVEKIEKVGVKVSVDTLRCWLNGHRQFPAFMVPVFMEALEINAEGFFEKVFRKL